MFVLDLVLCDYTLTVPKVVVRALLEKLSVYLAILAMARMSFSPNVCQVQAQTQVFCAFIFGSDALLIPF